VTALAPGWTPPEDDVDRSLTFIADDLARWRGARVLVTGGTGFLGRWMVYTTLRANERLKLGMQVEILSRRPNADLYSRFSDARIIKGDVTNYRTSEHFDVIIHGAASSSARYGVGDGAPATVVTTIVDGTRQILEIGANSGARVLFLSSGAVYGPQTSPVSERAVTAPDPLVPSSAYGLAKRVAENLCAAATRDHAVQATIARLFAFVGPGIPLDAHFAVGNFISNVLAQEVIEVKGDGRPLRSYLYSGDLSEWCWALLSKGLSGSAYNVGSPAPITVLELAQEVSRLTDPSVAIRVHLAPGNEPPPCYVPITERARSELKLEPRTPLDQALRKTFDWYRSAGQLA
jgi:nucleoside-diphosphate-sugar epimerase